MKWFLFPFLGLVTLASALADTHKVPPDEPIATVRIPDKWQTKEQGESVQATSPDGGVFLLVVSVDHNKIAETIGEVMQYLRNRDNIVVKAESRHDEKGKVNGMAAHFISWQGKGRNGDVEMKFIAVILAQNESLLAAYDGLPSANKKYRSELEGIIRSITKVEASSDQDRKPESENRK